MGPAVRVILVALLGMGGAEPRLPLALLGDENLAAARALSQVPLLLVPTSELALISNVHISSVSRSRPLVTCTLDKYNTLEATPAVRVVLRRPVLVESPDSAFQFPARLSVLHEGLRVSVPVGALLAPVPPAPGPYLIRVLYAVPTSPLSLQYPYYAPFHYPIRPEYTKFSSFVPTVHPSTIIQTSPIVNYVGNQVVQQKPETSVPVQGPQDSTNVIFNNLLVAGNKKPVKGPLITVLHFPDELATPSSLYYQPESEDELGNRNPPEAVIPAGVVQSSQPKPNLQLFINSKESPLLQALRDEAEQNSKLKIASPNSISVEAL